MAFLLLVLVLSLLQPSGRVQARYDPLSVPNNRYGIHIADVNDISEAAKLVNSSGGQWGYITVVIEEGDRNSGKWQELFDKMRRLRVIPIVRVATRLEGDRWSIPHADTIRDWVGFFASLNWPVENRYIVLYNEPNHAKEWGNRIDPEGYALILKQFAEALRESSEDYFILPAGMDVSARSDGASLDAAVYLRRMKDAVPDVFEKIDGWTSHSYPNPAFSGLPQDSGRGSLRSFEWELSLLRDLGLNKNLPVFITETGWQHSEGIRVQSSLLSTDTVGSYIKQAAGGIWTDGRIAAVTPFVFNYQGGPFDHFSFRKIADSSYYSHYQSYFDIPKTRGKPRIRQSYRLTESLFPARLVIRSTYSLSASLVNAGQAIVTPEEYDLVVASDRSDVRIKAEKIGPIEPGLTGHIRIGIQTPNILGNARMSISLTDGRDTFALEEKTVTFSPPPPLTIRAGTGLNPTPSGTSVSVIVYDPQESVLHKFDNVLLDEGIGRIGGIDNIVPEQRYRIVITSRGYLPRQTTVRFTTGQNVARFRPLLPLDYNFDGSFNAKDFPGMARLSFWEVVSAFFR